MSASVIEFEATMQDQAVIDIVIPVYNEEDCLEESVERVVTATERFPWSCRVTIADNASTDTTELIGHRLAHRHDRVDYVRIDRRGRGRALKQVWSASPSRVLVYMDVDLSTDLNALLPLVAPLVSGHSDLAIGSRLRHDSRVRRGPKREFISRTYNLMIRGAMRTRFSDAQCGFKAIRSDVADLLLPLIEDDAWFFDTELLVVAERAGLRIAEVPVDWIDDPDSSVDIVRTAIEDIKGLARLTRAMMRGDLPLVDVRTRIGRDRDPHGAAKIGVQAVIFAIIGGLSTLAYALIFLLARGVMPAQAANLVALLTTAVVNTAANRRFTFGLRGRDSAMRHQAQGLVLFGIGLGVTSGTLFALETTGLAANHGVEIAVLTAANLAVTIMRFLAMRTWVFRNRAPAL